MTWPGRSGCGKSSSERLLVGLESQTQGDMSRQGKPVSGLTARRKKRFAVTGRRQHC
ncbi:ATP-binding cassette domain-containing protein [Citrobacter sp. NCU1]|uniref:ATP-binding cassette domain-containing protein n=1 Tax=Citrobacter sp. NCU1 TaxID=2026683 RepID=UPI00406CFE7A